MLKCIIRKYIITFHNILKLVNGEHFYVKDQLLLIVTLHLQLKLKLRFSSRSSWAEFSFIFNSPIPPTQPRNVVKFEIKPQLVFRS